MVDINEVFSQLDKWVDDKKAAGYMPPDFDYRTHTLEVLPIFGMQQVRSEILEFAKLICSREWHESTILEIGLGYFGSSHFLWRHIFSKVITIEANHSRVNQFSLNHYNFFKKHKLNDGRSLFVIGKSQDSSSVGKVYDTVNQVDCLFIDGDHSYEGCLSDWLLYSPLVKSGGIVAFHDSLTSYHDSQVPKLLKELKSGKFGKKYNIHNIFYSKIVGISYYIVD